MAADPQVRFDGSHRKSRRHPEVIVCAGLPHCQWQGDEAMAAQMAGCPTCRRIVCHPNGSQTEYRKKAH